MLTLTAPGMPTWPAPRYVGGLRQVYRRSLSGPRSLGACCLAGNVAYVTDPHKWVIHGERLVDDTPHIRVSLADVELPNHVRFTQYVFRMRRCAMTVVLDF